MVKLILSLLVIGLLLGCALPFGIRPIQLPLPNQILIYGSGKVRTFLPGDADYNLMAGALNDFVSVLDSRAYTLYTQERFREELSSLPRIEVSYENNVTLPGKGLTIEARQLVIVAPGGDLIVLARLPDEDSWRVYMTYDTARLNNLRSVVKNQTGIELTTGGGPM